MLVGASRAREGMMFHPDQTTTWRRQAYQTFIHMVDIGRIWLGIRTQNGG